MNAKHLSAMYARLASSQSEAAVFFAGTEQRMQRIARVHHYGLRERIYQRGKRGPQVKYDARELLGLNDSSEELVIDILLRHISM